MVIETRGKQHFATPRNRILQKSVFQDLQHFEQGEDQGNCAYGAVYDLWIEQMKQLCPDISIPQGASKKHTSPAGNILETYKMVAEQVRDYTSDMINSNYKNCIMAARTHLMTVSEAPPDAHTPIYISLPTTHGYTSCTVWVCDIDSARVVASEMIDAFNRLHRTHSEPQQLKYLDWA